MFAILNVKFDENTSLRRQKYFYYDMTIFLEILIPKQVKTPKINFEAVLFYSTCQLVYEEGISQIFPRMSQKLSWSENTV